MSIHDVDITGTMAKPKENWQARCEELCKPENFHARINAVNLIGKVSNSEYERLYKKMRLVEEWAQYMAAGMLKGTLKYETDEHDLKTWMAHVIGEGADQASYQILMFDKWRRDEAKDSPTVRSTPSTG